MMIKCSNTLPHVLRDQENPHSLEVVQFLVFIVRIRQSLKSISHIQYLGQFSDSSSLFLFFFLANRTRIEPRLSDDSPIIVHIFICFSFLFGVVIVNVKVSLTGFFFSKSAL